MLAGSFGTIKQDYSRGSITVVVRVRYKATTFTLEAPIDSSFLIRRLGCIVPHDEDSPRDECGVN